MADLLEVALAQPEERGAVELGVAGDVIIRGRMERLALAVAPLFMSVVACLFDYGQTAPVVLLPGDIIAAFDQEDSLAGGRQLIRQRATTRAGAYDDDVVVSILCHVRSFADSSQSRSVNAP